MGEAKRRGTYEERVAYAKAQHAKSEGELLEEMLTDPEYHGAFSRQHDEARPLGEVLAGTITYQPNMIIVDDRVKRGEIPRLTTKELEDLEQGQWSNGVSQKYLYAGGGNKYNPNNARFTQHRTHPH